MGLREVTRGFRGLQGDYKGLERLRRVTKGLQGLRGLQGVMGGYKRLQRVTRGYRS